MSRQYFPNFGCYALSKNKTQSRPVSINEERSLGRGVSYHVLFEDGTYKWCPAEEVPDDIIAAWKEKYRPRPRFLKSRKGAPIEAWGGIYDVVRQIKEDEELLIKNGQGHILWS